VSDGTKIEWTEATWNPITGCSVTSPGCTNCYAMKLAGTRLRNHASRAGLTAESQAGPVWTGEVRFNEQWLDQPLRWKRPRMIFVCAHGDLFHESVPDKWIDRVFAVMALCPQHTFQVLTKRSARVREYLTDNLAVRVQNAVDNLEPDGLWKFKGHEPWVISDIRDSERGDYLPNLWLGVSVEDQARADERIPDLLATPAGVRWLSCEPLLGPVDLRSWLPDCYECGASCGLRLPSPPKVERCTECGEECGPETEPMFSEGCPKCSGELEFICPDCGHYMVYQHPDTPNLDWIVVGGESGPGARPMHPDWARSLRDQCAAAGVPFFFKQWGNYRPTSDANGEYMIPVAKKQAGRLLDGVQHDRMPRGQDA
jgi:protein gp37